MMKNKFDNNLISKMNRRLILDLIRRNGPINRAEVAHVTGLSIPTVMKITDELSRINLIRVIGKRKSIGGKRPELYEFIPNSFCTIGLDIGRNKIRALVMDMSAKIIAKKEIRTEETHPESELIERLIVLVKELIAESSLNENEILGLGIGMPGLLDTEAGVVLFSPDFNWEHIPLIEKFEEEFSFRTVLENSNRTLALGEHWFGAGTDSNDLICVNLGYGIGAGIIENGEIIQGSSGSNGEFGHIILDKNGPICSCGNRGCLEAISSGYAIANQIKHMVEQGTSSIVTEMCGGDLSRIDAKLVFKAAFLDDELCKKVINNAVEYIGIGIAALINLFDPEQIILSGGITKSSETFKENLEIIIQNNQMRFAGRKVQIKYGKLGDNASAIGAATLLIKQLIDNGGFIDSLDIPL